MFKKIIALLLVCAMSSGTITSFAASNNSLETETIVKDGIEKTIQYFDEIKIVYWENEDELIVEQYDLDGILVETNIGNKESKEILVENSEGSYAMNANDVLSIISEEDLPVTYSFSKVGSVQATNLITSTRKTMNLFEQQGSAKNTTYKVSKYNGTLSNFITAVSIGIGVGLGVSGLIAQAFASAGLGVIAGKIIDITSTVTLSCKAYAYDYYGIDSISGAQSSTYSKAGNKYIINDDNNVAFKNKTYYDGLVYNKLGSGEDHRLSTLLVGNLYGVDYEVY